MVNRESYMDMDHQSTPGIPDMSEATPLITSTSMSKAQRRVARVQVVALCCSMFLVGWSDGSVGPLLPKIRRVYNVDYQTVSWIFVMTCGGMVLGGLANIPLSENFKFGKILLFGSVFQSCAYMVQTNVPSFPIFVLCFLVSNIGRTIQDTQASAFIALVKTDGAGKMAIIQAAYGIGFLVGPLSAAYFSQMRSWSLHFFVSFLLSVFNMVFLGLVFRFKRQDDCLQQAGEVIPPQIQTSREDGNKYGQILRSKAVHLLALYLLLYIGAAVTIGGWIVTFIIDQRGGGPDSGYVSAAFSAGLTLGRIVLVPLSQRVGEVNVMYLYITLAVFSQIFVWFVPSILLDSIALFALGLMFGPMYPILVRHTARVVPRSLVTGSISWIAAFGAGGSAILPFLTGWMAQRWGIISLQPFLVVMMSVMGVVWFTVPKELLPE